MPISFLLSVMLGYTPVHQPQQRDETCLCLFRVSPEVPQPKAHAKSEKVCQRERCNELHVDLVRWSAAKTVTASSSKEQAVNSLVPSFMLWTPKYRQGLSLSPEGLTSPHTPKSCLPLMPLELYLFGFVKQCGRLK